MASNPYSQLPSSAFWKTGVAEENPYCVNGIFKKKFSIAAGTRIATAGSCFAQHIARHLKKNGYNVIDVEPAPPGLADNLHRRYGFSTYSARYGNIYTTRQLLQLAQEAANEWTPVDFIWEKDGQYFDALRPVVEPDGLDSPEEVIEHRHFHIAKVGRLLREFDLLIFTLGLTEAWIHRDSGTVYPTAPGTIAGAFDESSHAFHNCDFSEVIEDFNKFQQVIMKIRGGRPFKVILTVSPVPLTATASGKHVLVSTAYSKAILRSVAGQLSTNQQHIDYFPSFEIVTNPRLHSTSFTENLRTVRNEAVENVMRRFFSEHPSVIAQKEASKYLTESANLQEDLQCEEAILEVFGK